VKIHLYGRDKNADKISDFKATTYNLENNSIIENHLDSKDLFEERKSSSNIVKKFTMPALKVGSIIDYEYTIISKNYYYLPAWNFQHINFPCLYSQYTVVVPDLLRYLFLKSGIDSIGYTVQELDRQVIYQMSNFNVSTKAKKYSWVARNLPAFTVENYLYNQSSFLDKIEFILYQTNNGEDVNNVAVNWKETTRKLANESDFGRSTDLETNSNLINTVDKICGNETDKLACSKLIHAYLRDNFSGYDNDFIYSENDMYDINKSKRGSSAEINLLLISLLKLKNIVAEPVILTTRDYGTNLSTYPLLNKINYVVCREVIDNDTIFLDASKPYLAFGNLPLECYNGHARVINKSGGESVFLNADAQNEFKSISVFISNDIKGVINGTYEIVPGRFESDNFRDNFTKNGMNKYFDAIHSSMPDGTTISNKKIDSLTKPDMPLVFHFDFTQKIDSTSEIIYFNPILSEIKGKNPFFQNERKYPVELDYPMQESFILNMAIPLGYTVAELPKSVKVVLDGKEASFIFQTSQHGAIIELMYKVSVNKAIFYPESYDSLRDFYAFVIKKLDEQIVLKKIN
jgi:hypothetical protein